MSTTIRERTVDVADDFANDTEALPPTPGRGARPCARPSWSGLLRLNLVTIPVKAYAAHTNGAGIQFNQLHAGCGQRIQHQKRCPVHGCVDAADIARGFQYVPGQYVLVDSEELENLRPAKDKSLVLEQLIPLNQVDPLFFAGRSLYLLPDGVAARHPYGVIAEALQQRGQWALGRVVLSAHRQLVLVRPRGRLLVMDVLRYPSELRLPAPWEADLRTAPATSEESRWIRLLLDAGSTPLDWRKYRDDTVEELTALIEAKIAGRPLAAPAEERVSALPLLDALKQSVAAAQPSAEAVKSKHRNPFFRKRAPA